MNTDPVRPPVPPFIRDTAAQKVRATEDAWNSRDPVRVSLAYTVDSKCRNRAEHLESREEIVAFLERKWARELEYRLIKELWSFDGARIAVRRYFGVLGRRSQFADSACASHAGRRRVPNADCHGAGG